MLFTYLTSFCEVRQIAKIPILVEHYVKHKMAKHNMSIYAFFKMHYLDKQVKDKDYNEDLSLPFKKHDNFTTFLTLNIPPEKTVIFTQYHSICVDVSSDFSYSEKFYPSVFQKIWEPPKI
ncbi:hypothetical protein SAMN05443292_0635 [Halpernia frigidisoli]|uniref:Uncharacterized protein n=2 Tax=Halpernia frigidisoli TaxID=1125876 RepID=A0A1I3DQV2_9FLAO|nr:hypothetical protein SAMN05443292_0635 [Halpernia frigidisoli]